MASEEQIILSDFIKKVHKDLRKEYKKNGETAWEQHLENSKTLENYAEAMKDLSHFWSKNKSETQNRISWTVSEALNYFNERIFACRQKEEEILNLILNENLDILEVTPLHRRLTETEKFKLLDVGSCFNPFKNYSDIFDVTAIDIAPSKDTGVLKMDFLNAQITNGTELQSCHNRLRNLPRNYFDVVVFSLLLEYLPSSQHRITAVRQAYEVLDNEGILVVITPDSKHVGSNAKLMKNWRYTLALFGFSRIKFEKLQHVTCMVFRKSVSQLVTERWARLHKEPYMTEEINIPQDFGDEETLNDLDLAANLKEFCDLKNTVHLLNELPNNC